jgi:thiol-disulfide isomerase/thioredoxin
MKTIVLTDTTKNDFVAAVKDKKPTLFFCYADWCGHCQRFKPTWEKVKKTLATNKDVNVVEVDYAHISLLPKSLQNIRGFPTIQIVKNGRVSKEYPGDRTHDDVVKFASEEGKKSADSSNALKKKKAKTI